MRPTDLLILPLAALWQQKLRTILTTLGVVFGAFVLAASLSIGEGVQETIARQSRLNDISRRVDVYPRWDDPPSKAAAAEIQVEGAMADDRRDRIRKSLANLKRNSAPAPVRLVLDEGRLARLAAIPHVERAIPTNSDLTYASFAGKSEAAQVVSTRPDNEERRARIMAGRYFDSADEHALIISEFFAYRLGLHGEAEARGLIGKPLRLEFRGRKSESGLYINIMKPLLLLSRAQSSAIEKIQSRLPDALEKLDLTKEEADAFRAALKPGPVSEPETYAEEFNVIGVIRYATDEEKNKGSRDPYGHLDADLLLPYQAAKDVFFKSPGRREQGLDTVTLLVDKEENVKEVVRLVQEQGLSGSAAIEFIERERLIYLLIFGGMTCVAGVALLVSALGIANTMLMSVLERTREIGIMKAVGADNRHLQFIFLVEGGLIGALGGGLGLLLAWSASFPADAWVRSMVLRDIKIDLKGSIFVFPGWIAPTVLIFTVLVTTIAALYPARYAARIDPVKALRHE